MPGRDSTRLDSTRLPLAVHTSLCLAAALCGCNDDADPVAVLPGEHVTVVSFVPDAEICPGRTNGTSTSKLPATSRPTCSRRTDFRRTNRCSRRSSAERRATKSTLRSCRRTARTSRRCSRTSSRARPTSSIGIASAYPSASRSPRRSSTRTSPCRRRSSARTSAFAASSRTATVGSRSRSSSIPRGPTSRASAVRRGFASIRAHRRPTRRPRGSGSCSARPSCSAGFRRNARSALRPRAARARALWLDGNHRLRAVPRNCDAQVCEVLSARAGFEIDLAPGYYVLRAERTSTSNAGGSLTLEPLDVDASTGGGDGGG